MISAAGPPALEKWTYAGGFLERAEKPTRAELLGYPDAVLEQAGIVHLFELPDPPLPPADGRPLKNWRITVDFVCHDIKFGSAAEGVFQWPEAPAGDVLQTMQNVLMADKLSVRGDGPGWIDICEVLETKVTETSDPPTYR